MRSLLLVPILLLNSCDSDRIAKLEKKTADLAAKLDAQGRAANLTLQEQCSRQAERSFKNNGWDKEQLASFENHYNVKLNKCFVKTEDTGTKYGSPTVSKSVSDAFEGKIYGNYLWINSKKQKYWEVKPLECTVTASSGEEKTCESDQEFDQLIKIYMEN